MLEPNSTSTSGRASDKTNQSLSRRVALTLFLYLPAVVLFTACPKNDIDRGNSRVSVSTGSPRQVETPAPIPSAFNGERAFEHVRKQVEIGPRVPGSPELAKTRQYILSELKSYGLTTHTDEFVVSTPVGEKRMANITAQLAGESENTIIIASHYDTKLYTDMQFVGANDPGASVGALLELGRVLGTSGRKPKLTYWLVFFDGEEAFCEEWEECGKPGAPDNTYGSRRYVSQLQSQGKLSLVRALILLDMMGYKNLELGRDTMSTKWLQDIIWQTGRELGFGSVFVDRPEGVGGDDHEPFLRAGIDSVDLIQLNGYPYWHRADDTLDKVSARSLKIVGDVVLASLPRIEKRLLESNR
ncbi:MAG TPA: M28 family peptidase [Pyrinomonadaceae bacterium]|nr:M28 family peptidase [Pyrinomonadaceae bacterium]